MDHRKVDEWQKAVDTAELSPITQNLPADSPAGAVFEEFGDIHRKWLRIEILSGNSGARWAYWAGSVYPHPEFKAIADSIFNGDAAHFIGMLGIPYVKIPGSASLMWCLIEPRMVEPRKPWIFEEKKERYERSKEIYDVETHTSTKLP